jgi:IPT/TIG domain
VIGTLTAAFFGIQAAGAGRSQAMTALSEQLKAQGGTAAYKLEPSYGPHAGGTLVSISGNGFTGANAVNFGVTLGTDFKNINDGLVRANSPQAPQGVDDTKVVVVFPGASPTNREVGTFYYYTIDPSRGRASSENTVTIRGSGLKGANAVKFGTTDATDLEFGTSAGGPYLQVKVPAHSVTSPPGTAGTDVDVAVLFPVASPTNSFVVGRYHYD